MKLSILEEYIMVFTVEKIGIPRKDSMVFWSGYNVISLRIQGMCRPVWYLEYPRDALECQIRWKEKYGRLELRWMDFVELDVWNMAVTNNK